ncbi:MAG: penicillin-binding protein 2 [bacterium]
MSKRWKRNALKRPVSKPPPRRHGAMTSAHEYLHATRVIHSRLVFAFALIAVLVVILIARLGYIQLAQHERFSTLAQDNRISLAPLVPVRGLIYDRNGAPLASNFRVYSLDILPAQVADMDRLLDQLGQLVEVGEADLRRFRTALRERPSFEWQTLRAQLSEVEAARIALNQHRHTGVELRARLQRHYPEGALTAHAVGYVGRINPQDLARINPRAYYGLDYIGRSGVEERYEQIMLGIPGVERVETNAHGRAVRSIEKSPPVAGRSLHLGLDLELQRQSMHALRGREGAVVAIQPSTGEVLAFASAPGFDPNPFVNGIDRDAYAALRDASNLPLFNRALYGRYAPGSTIKGFMALIGLDNDLDPDREVICRGAFRLPNSRHRYRDWKPHGHGAVDAHDGIEQSCDVYFYTLAHDLGIERLGDGLARFGFGARSGIDLNGEPSGLLPSPQWKRRTQGVQWYPGETVISGIGQGYMLTTPLQLATATAILANRGVRVTPRLLRAVENAQTHARQSAAPARAPTERIEMRRDDSYDYVIAAMRDVVHGERGTARGIGRGIRYQMAGKTGTAQVKSIPQGESYDEAATAKKHRDHSLFIGFAPLERPEIAIAVIVEHAGSGSRVAAPIARRLIDFYLLERLGLFQDDDDSKQKDGDETLTVAN